MDREKTEQLLNTGNDQLRKLNRIVLNAVEEAGLLSQKPFKIKGVLNK